MMHCMYTALYSHRTVMHCDAGAFICVYCEVKCILHNVTEYILIFATARIEEVINSSSCAGVCSNVSVSKQY